MNFELRLPEFLKKQRGFHVSDHVLCEAEHEERHTGRRVWKGRQDLSGHCRLEKGIPVARNVVGSLHSAHRIQHASASSLGSQAYLTGVQQAQQVITTELSMEFSWNN